MALNPRVQTLLDLLKDIHGDCLRYIMNEIWPNKLQLMEMTDAEFNELVEKIKSSIANECDGDSGYSGKL